MKTNPKPAKRKFVVTVEGLDDIGSAIVSEYIREAVQCWGGQWSDMHGMDERYRISSSRPTVRPIGKYDREVES